ncbi:hypothetical protein [Humibacillus xanthopallidus]|uniref:hypothetical protein n=1 Tax=Humibacillus xanthopallidus TaxID=412689 RepID=UPI003850E254
MTASTDATEDAGAGGVAGAGIGVDGWAGSSVVTAGPVVDRFETDDGIVVMVASGAAHRIVRLSPLGQALLDAVGDVTTLGELEAAMLEQLGPPPDGDLAGAVLSAVHGLVDTGLLSVSPPTSM